MNIYFIKHYGQNNNYENTHSPMLTLSVLKVERKGTSFVGESPELARQMCNLFTFTLLSQGPLTSRTVSGRLTK